MDRSMKLLGEDGGGSWVVSPKSYFPAEPLHLSQTLVAGEDIPVVG
jgi:hypothetical protein